MVNKHKPKSQKSQFSPLRFITTSTQSFLIWWTGVDNQKLPQHLKKSYAGLGAMAIVSTTLATFGGYTFILISLASPLGGIFGGVLAGSFMWGMDRSILSFSTNLNLSFLVKLLVNIIFSTALTTPLTTLMLMGAVQVRNVDKIESKIEQKEQSIENKEEEIRKLRVNYDKIRSQYLQKYNADLTINESYVKNEENAIKALERAEEEKDELAQENKELKEEKKAYESGDLTKASLKFPDQFNYVMSEARWSDNLLSSLFFLVTALMGSGAVLIKNLVFTNDSYSEILKHLEEEAKYEDQLQYTMKTSANQIYYSLFNTDAMGQDIKTKVKELQDELESEVIEICKSSHEKFLAKIREQAEKYALELDDKFASATSQNYQVKNGNFPDPWVDNKDNNHTSGDSSTKGSNQNKSTENRENGNQTIATNDLASADKNSPNGNQNQSKNLDDVETAQSTVNGENSNQTIATTEEIVNFLRQTKRKN